MPLNGTVRGPLWFAYWDGQASRQACPLSSASWDSTGRVALKAER